MFGYRSWFIYRGLFFLFEVHIISFRPHYQNTFQYDYNKPLNNDQTYNIMNVQKDSVVNFLTPTKLVHGTLKPRPKVNLNQSQNSHSTNKNNQEKWSNNVSNHNVNQSMRLQQSFEKSRMKEDNIYLNESKETAKPVDTNFMLYDTSRTVLRSQENFKLLVEEKPNIKIGGIQKSQISLHPVQGDVNPPVGQILAKINSSYKNSRAYSNRGEQFGKNIDVQRNQKEEQPSYSTSKNNLMKFQGSIDEVNKVIQILRGVRDSLDSSLNQLQYVLDNTSKYLSDINQEYHRIKHRILDYTSQVLDASFTRYTENMINWTKYEQVQKKSIVIKNQLEKTLKQDQLIVREMIKSTKASRLTLGKQQEIEEKIQFYGGFVNELQTATQQCMKMHPQIKNEKVAAFQQALFDLANF